MRLRESALSNHRPARGARSVPLPLLPASHRLGLWVGAYFPNDKVSLLSGDLNHHRYQTQSGNNVTTSFCSACGTTTHWQKNSEFLDGKTAIAVGTLTRPLSGLILTARFSCVPKPPLSRLMPKTSLKPLALTSR